MPDDAVVADEIDTITPGAHPKTLLFRDIESGKLQTALTRDELPTPGVLHHSSRLRLHEDLEEAWYAFQSPVTGGISDDDPIIKALRAIDNQ